MSHSVKFNEEIVISGISGAYPLSENVHEFKKNLFSRKHLVAYPDRIKEDGCHPTEKFGSLKNIDKFDNSFFHVNNKYAEEMEPVSRMLLEKTFEAIVDSGYNPIEFKKTNTGVFIGSCIIDIVDPRKEINEFAAIGRFKSVYANRISYWLDITGPSCLIDTACSSSLTAVENGYRAIQGGICDAAIIGGVNICTDNSMAESYRKLQVYSSDWTCKTFDEKANGFVRAEAVVSLILQKKKNARRIYANLIHVKTNCDGFKIDGFTCPSGESHKKLYQNFYREINLDPHFVDYVEAHGTATKVGDVLEVGAIDDFFCKGRSKPLKIGSVKSNMGHSEGAAGMSSITKIIIANECGLIPPNINLNKLNTKIPAFNDGRIEVVTEPTPCEKYLIGINSFGIGGANGHALLSPNPKEKKLPETSVVDIPCLVLVSGRTEEAVDVLLNDLEKHKQNMEYVALYHKIFAEDINGHLYRGYSLLQNEKNSFKHKMHYSNEQRPIWFVFAGMGSQWPTMGKALMKIPNFAKSIRNSHEILKTKNLDLLNVITENDPKIFDNILHSFVGIAAIQIALIDLLKEIEIFPDGMIGHSVGELGCAYADGCLTAEQMILVAYYRGLVSLETKIAPGTMAAVGAGYDKMKDMIPPEIEIACHNGPDSCTLSGPTENIEEFVNVLKKKNILVRTVNTANIAYHSRYIALAGPKFLSLLNQTIPEKKLRSPKWVCTSAPELEWNSDLVKYSSPEYHTRNLLKPVLFEEGSKHIPDNAITIEIAPHGLLQAILKRSLPSTVDNISLTMKNHENPVKYLLSALGKLYELGVNLKLHNLYPPIKFPVSRGTPMISHLIKWQHDETFSIGGESNQKFGERNVVIKVTNPDFQYLTGHVIDGRNIFPATGYLVLAWQTVAIMNSKNIKETPVVFENVCFERATNISENGSIEFYINVQKGTGNFEILNNELVVVKGRVYTPKNLNKESMNRPPIEDKLESDAIPLGARDIYKELRLRGYDYKGLFKKVTYLNPNGKVGKVSWKDNFVTFMDTMAHIAILNEDLRDLAIPTGIRKIVIDVQKHFDILKTLSKENPEFPVYYYKNENLLCSGGVEMKGLKFTAITRRKNIADPVLEKYQFVAYHNNSDEETDLYANIRLCFHIVLENNLLNEIKCVEVLKEEPINEDSLISKMVAIILADFPLIQANISILVNENHSLNEENLSGIKIQTGKLQPNNSHVVIASNISNNKDILSKIIHTLRERAFIITKENIIDNEVIEKLGFNICFTRIISDQKLFLLQKKSFIGQSLAAIQITNSSYSWIELVKKHLDEKKHDKIILYSENEPLSGILGLFNCLQKELNNHNLRCFFILDDDAPDFSLDDEFYLKQLKKNLTHNVYKNGKWGSYRHMVLEPLNNIKSVHAIANIAVRGDLSTLAWFEGQLDLSNLISNDEHLIHPYFVALNFRDIILALGKIHPSDMSYTNRLKQENTMGFEFCGKDINGERFMGVTQGKGISNHILARPFMMWKVPDYWTMEEASTVPLAYYTAITALMRYGRLKKEHSVLIHAGSGGVGQACLNICSYYGCTIFTTVGTSEKVEFIRNTFPQIPESHIGNSRNTSFEQLIMEKTNYRGVDLVLNSLSEDLLKASVRCVAAGGKFMEIGKFDLAKNNILELGHFINGISFHSIQLDLTFGTDDWLNFKEDWNLMNEFINNGIIKPLIRTVFAADELELAFRYMATGQHIGKVLIKIRDEDSNIRSKPKILYLPAKPMVLCKAEKSYVIVGGLGGFGLELADWLILRGARNIVLNSRNGIQEGYQSYRIQIWKSYGANVIINKDNVTVKEGVEKLLEIANALGPVDGIFNLAVALQDGPFREQTKENYKIAASPKEIATIHLDQLSRKMCSNLNYFVVFSSVSCGRGNINQTTYGMTNSVMERICEARVADNLPALAVEWGAIGEVGIVADMAENNPNIVIGGTLQQKISSCLEVLNDFMKQSNPIVSSIVVAQKQLVGSNIINVLANVLGIKDLKTVSSIWTLPELGLDSMTAVELQSILNAEFGTFFTPKEIKNLSFSKIYKLIEAKEKKPELIFENSLEENENSFDNTSLLPIIRTPSLAENGSIEEVSAETNPTVFYFPGLEGDSSLAKQLALNLPVQVLCLQYYNDGFSNNFQKTANYFASRILDKLGSNQKFHIIGYSAGTIVATETIRILENQGRTGHLWLIDGSLDYIEARLGKKFCITKSDWELQAIKAIFSILTNFPIDKIDEKVFKRLAEAKDWDEIKKYMLPLISELFGSKYAENRTKFVHNLHQSICNYQFLNEKLKTETILIRSLADDYNLNEDYGLSKFFKNPVKVYLIDACHVKIVSEERTTKIITETIAKSLNER